MAENWAVALVGLPSESPTAWGVVKRRSGELVSKNFSVSKPSLIVVIPPTGLRAGEEAGVERAIRQALLRKKPALHRLLQKLKGGARGQPLPLSLVVQLNQGGGQNGAGGSSKGLDNVAQQVGRSMEAFADSCGVEARALIKRQGKAPVKDAKSWFGQHVRPGGRTEEEREGEGKNKEAVEALLALSGLPNEDGGARGEAVSVVMGGDEEGQSLRQQGGCCSRCCYVLGAAVPRGLSSAAGTALRITGMREPGTGLLKVSGHLSAEMVEVALVARSFLQLHGPWLQATYGPLALHPASDSEDVRLHVDHTLSLITGHSLGAALLVALASVYVGRPVVGSVGVLGKISLSGGMTAVSDLTRKIMAMEQAAEGYRRAAHPVPGSEQQPTAPLVVVVPTDSVYGKTSRLLESSTGAKVQLPRRLLKKLRVVAVDSMFACLRLLLPPPVAAEQAGSSSSSGAAVEGRRAAAGGAVVVVKVLLPDLARSSFGWGQVQLVECGRLPASSPPSSSSGQEQQLACRPSAGVMCTPSAQREVVEVVDLGVAWLRQQWAVVSARYSASSSTAPPPGLLHIHFPGFLVNGCVSAAAVVAAAATWLGRSVPGHVAIIGETDATGGVVGRLGDEGDAETVLRLAHFNGVRLVLVPASSESGRQVVALARRRAKLYSGLEVVGVDTVLDALDRVFKSSAGESEGSVG